MKKLILSFNSLRELPESINELVELRELYLGDNNLEWLPELTSLKKLEILSIQNNQLRLLPQNLSLLTSLKSLNIKGNLLPLEEIECVEEALPDAFIDIKSEPKVITIKRSMIPGEMIMDYHITEY